MRSFWKLCLMMAATTAASVIVSEPLSARGGAANIMNSPGYQRRLQESRQQLSQPGATVNAQRKTSRHRYRLCLQIDHGAPRNARHTSSFPAFVDEALGEDLGGCCGQLYARQFPAVSFEMNTHAPSAFRIT
jgi:hypothetical protein